MFATRPQHDEIVLHLVTQNPDLAIRVTTQATALSAAEATILFSSPDLRVGALAASGGLGLAAWPSVPSFGPGQWQDDDAVDVRLIVVNPVDFQYCSLGVAGFRMLGIGLKACLLCPTAETAWRSCAITSFVAATDSVQSCSYTQWSLPLLVCCSVALQVASLLRVRRVRSAPSEVHKISEGRSRGMPEAKYLLYMHSIGSTKAAQLRKLGFAACFFSGGSQPATDPACLHVPHTAKSCGEHKILQCTRGGH